MSHDLYSTRLFFLHGRGVAKLRGTLVHIGVVPDLPGVQVVGIDYAPEVRLAMVMPYAEPWRDMTPDEIQHADALLVRLVCQGAS